MALLKLTDILKNKIAKQKTISHAKAAQVCLLCNQILSDKDGFNLDAKKYTAKSFNKREGLLIIKTKGYIETQNLYFLLPKLKEELNQKLKEKTVKKIIIKNL